MAAAEHSTSESWAEIGVKVGGDNELLRNLLTDVARRIEALDDLREIFGAAVTPIGEALASLEHEKFDNIKLRSLFDDINSAIRRCAPNMPNCASKPRRTSRRAISCAATLLPRRRRQRRSRAAKTDLTRELDVTLGKVVDLERRSIKRPPPRGFSPSTIRR